MGSDRTGSSDSTVQTQRWQTTPIGPGLSDGHSVRASKRDSLADVTERVGLRSGMTCWRRLRDWQEEGILQLIHFVLLDWLARYGQIDWSRAVLDSCSIRAVFGGAKRGLIRPIGRSSAASAI